TRWLFHHCFIGTFLGRLFRWLLIASVWLLSLGWIDGFLVRRGQVFCDRFIRPFLQPLHGLLVTTFGLLFWARAISFFARRGQLFRNNFVGAFLRFLHGLLDTSFRDRTVNLLVSTRQLLEHRNVDSFLQSLLATRFRRLFWDCMMDFLFVLFVAGRFGGTSSANNFDATTHSS
ncbi:hypothetical protein M514_06409, partial [Trichuris suis]